jgi:hypothetical protein
MRLTYHQRRDEPTVVNVAAVLPRRGVLFGDPFSHWGTACPHRERDSSRSVLFWASRS